MNGKHLIFERISRAPVLKEGAWVLAGQSAAALGGLVGVRVLTQLAPAAVYGEVALLLGVLALGKQVFLAPVSNAQLRFHPGYRRQGLAGWFTARIARFAWGSTAVFIVAGVGAYVAWVGVSDSRLRPVLLGSLVVLAVLETAKVIQVNRLNAERVQSLAFGWRGLEAWLWAAFAAAALLVSPSPGAYVGGLALGSAVAFVVFMALIERRKRTRPFDSRTVEAVELAASELRKSVLRYGLPFVPLALLAWVHNLGDRYLVGAFLSSAAVGRYAAAYAIASQPFILLSAVATGVARPILFESRSPGSEPVSRRVFRLWLTGIVTAGACGVLLFALLGPWIAGLLLAAPYRGGAPTLFVWIGAAYALLAVAQTIENGIMAHGSSARLIVPGAWAAGINLGLNLLLIPWLGIVGAAMATAAGFAAQVLALGWVYVHLSPQAMAVHESPVSGSGGSPPSRVELQLSASKQEARG